MDGTVLVWMPRLRCRSGCSWYTELTDWLVIYYNIPAYYKRINETM